MRDGSSEPEHLTVRDENDGEVLEDCVDGYGEVLDCPCAGVDHADEEEGDWEPYTIRDYCASGERLTFSGFVGVEVTICDPSYRLATLDDCDTHKRLSD